MTPPSWLYWPDDGGGSVDLISFESDATSPSNPQTLPHTNLEQTTLAGDGGLLWDGRSLVNAVEAKGAPSPDFFYVYFDNVTDANTALAQFSSFTLTDSTSGTDYALTPTVDSANSRLKFLTDSDVVWVDTNDYILRGTP